jgi:hypothetical protein
MVLISIDPFALKKTFLLVAALLGLSSALCFADPLFMSSQFAGHDRRSHRVSSAAFSASLQSQKTFSGRLEEAPFDSVIEWLPCNSE